MFGDVNTVPTYGDGNTVSQKISPEFVFDAFKTPEFSFDNFKDSNEIRFLSCQFERRDGQGFSAPPGLSPPRQRPADTTTEAALLDPKNDPVKARSLRFAPKKRDLISQFSTHNGPITTLMIRNIPCRVTQQQLVDVIDSMGFSGKYDFLYLPTGGRSSTTGSSNLGYGFINFIDPEFAEPFTDTFQNFQFEGTSSTKVLTVKPAHIQGLENNIVHFDRTATKGRARERGPFIRPSQNGSQVYAFEGGSSEDGQ